MQLMRFASPLVFALALAAGSASPAAAQSVTTTDVQRLQDSIYDASRAIGQLRSRDASAASQLQAELDDVVRRGDLPEGQAAQERADRPPRLRSTSAITSTASAAGARGDRGGWQPDAEQVPPSTIVRSPPRAIRTARRLPATAAIRRSDAVARRIRTRFRSRPSSTSGCRIRSARRPRRSRIASRRRRWWICATSAGACWCRPAR